MTRKTGYLANLLNVPPLIFKFQFNPDLLSEKRSYGYRQTDDFGNWSFDKTAAATGALGKVFGALEDIKEMGSHLVNTKPLTVDGGGKPRTIALEFALDARDMPTSVAGQGGGSAGADKRFGGRIEPSLAVLRSFVNPSLTPAQARDVLMGDALKGVPAPPLCSLKLGGLELDCVVSDLNIKLTKFRTDLTPERAEVSLTLTEQTQSTATVLDVIGRLVEVGKSYTQVSAADLVQVAPGAGLVQNIFEV
ncbi:hypothetical protein [Streptomyces melanogenes]|uniref:hypothetical protein n=1 Tax=Streptomyces melanogenes TaxID=67326 RepID=UPI0037954360